MRGGTSEKIVEVSFNESKEKERLKTLQPILDFYHIKPSPILWGEEVRDHPYYKKFSSEITLNPICASINNILFYEKHKDSDKYLLLFESDATPLYDMAYIDTEINKNIQEMKDKNIDFVFLGKGHLDSIDTSQYEKITDTLYKSSTSRCGESYIISPNGMKKYLEYFYKTENHNALDLDLNNFFKVTPECLVCWRVPELFKQDKNYFSTLHDSITKKQRGGKHTRIPKVIYQSWKTKDLPKEVEDLRKTYIDKNPGYELKLFDHDDMDEFIRSNFDKRIFEAYSKLSVGAGKSDFWRYCVLYINGGVYIDMDSTIEKSLDDLIHENDQCVISREKNPGKFVQWFLVFQRGHPILKEVIDICVQNINNKVSTDLVELTGPVPFTKAINNIMSKYYSKSVEKLYNETDENLNKEFNNPNSEVKCRVYEYDYGSFVNHHMDKRIEEILRKGHTHWRQNSNVYKG